MSIDFRILSQLPEEFFRQNDDTAKLGATVQGEADINGDHILGQATINRNNGQTPININEAEYAYYRNILLSRALNSSTTDENRQRIFTVLNDPQECLGSFWREKNAHQLGNIEREAQAWALRADQAVQDYLSHLDFSLQTYTQIPQSFRNHIAPNYFVHLAKVGGADADGNGVSTVEEVRALLQRENREQIRQNETQTNQLFNQADENHDHFLDLAEFTPLAHLFGFTEEAEVRSRFNRLDTSNPQDHKLDLNEFKAQHQSTPATEEELRTQAQNLILQARRELESAQNLINRDPENFREIDRLSARLSVFNLGYLTQLPGNSGQLDIFRILRWMRSQEPQDRHLIRSERVDQLLQSHAKDIKPMTDNFLTFLQIIRQRGGIEERNPDFQILHNFILRFRDFAHGIITEEDLRNRILANPETHELQSLPLNAIILAIQHLKENLESSQQIPPQILEMLSQRMLASLRPFIHLAGEDAILTREDIDRVLTRQRAAIRQRNPESHEEPHFFEELWKNFDDTQIRNADHSVYSLSEEPVRRIDGNQFLANALVQYTYLHHQDTLGIIEQTERNELFYLIEHVAEGIHRRAQSRAGNGVPGVLHYLTYPLHWVGGLSWRERIIHHADGQHQNRLAAIEALRNTLQQGSSIRNLREAIELIQDPEQKRILREELHVPEIERIYYIPNSREQEEAYIRFATYTLRGQVNSENGIVAAFQSRFAPSNIHSVGDLLLNHWQFRNGPAAHTIYDRLMSYSEHSQIRSEAREASLDYNGNGGDINPQHWTLNWKDEEASLDGIWDLALHETLLFGGGSLAFRSLRHLLGMGGSFSEPFLSPGFWRGAISRPITAIPFTGPMQRLATHSNRWIRASSFLARVPVGIINMPFSRQLSAAEVEIVNRNALRLARNTRWGGFLRWRQLQGFLNNMRANLMSARLLMNRNPQEGAARVLRFTQNLLRESEASFAEAQRLSTEAQTLAHNPATLSTNLATIERNLSDAADLARAGHSMRQLAVTQRGGVGIMVDESSTFSGLQSQLTSANEINTLLQEARTSHALTGPEVAQTLSRIRTHIRNFQSIESGMQGLTNYQRSMMARGAMAGGALMSLAGLSENISASQVASRMVNPTLVMANNPAMQGISWQIYYLAWNIAHKTTLTDQYRSSPSFEDWALEYVDDQNALNQEQLMETYHLHQRYRGSQAVFRNVFLNPIRTGNESEVLREENLDFPENVITPGENGSSPH